MRLAVVGLAVPFAGAAMWWGRKYMQDQHTKRVSKALVSVFESGRPDGDPGAVVVLVDGAGISYGKHQGTDESGALDAVVAEYIARGGRFADELRPYMAYLRDDLTTAYGPGNLPGWMRDLMALLQRAGREDPLMERVQDDVFERVYWTPAAAKSRELGLREPLSMAVIYDTYIQSNESVLNWLRQRFAERTPADGGDEREWTAAYLAQRHRWLSTHSNAAVRASAYRTAALLELVADDNWSLSTPIRIARPRAVIE